MFHDIVHVFKHALIITGFVFVMMAAIEYLNVQTQGIWQEKILDQKWKQYIAAAILGAAPGCLGAFTAAALFSHRLISFGAVVTAMIATSGDEAFVLFAMIPQQAVLLTGILFFTGIIAGYLTDKLFDFSAIADKLAEKKLPLHKDSCKCFDKENILQLTNKPSAPRLLMLLIILLMIFGIFSGMLMEQAELWKKLTLLAAFLFTLFIIITVPDHFLKDHLWVHIVKQHIPRIFLWTFGAMLFIHFLLNYLNMESWIMDKMFVVLLIAVLIGFIPESGPHLIFVTLFAAGNIPFSILLASSISQDGHGMLPLLAESKRSFFIIKIINGAAALIAGLLGYFAGF